MPPRVERIPAARLLADLPAGARVTVTSPGALTYDSRRGPGRHVQRLPVFLPGQHAPYSFLAGYAVAAGAPGRPQPLWRHPLAATPAGAPLPGPGTFGQPALFGLGGPDGLQRTGVVINTVRTGTYISRG